jgi:hypothetical protein
MNLKNIRVYLHFFRLHSSLKAPVEEYGSTGGPGGNSMAPDESLLQHTPLLSSPIVSTRATSTPTLPRDIGVPTIGKNAATSSWLCTGKVPAKVCWGIAEHEDVGDGSRSELPGIGEAVAGTMLGLKVVLVIVLGSFTSRCGPVIPECGKSSIEN